MSTPASHITLSLHDSLPISLEDRRDRRGVRRRTTDTVLLEGFDQRRLGVARRRLGEVLRRRDRLDGRLVTRLQRRQRPVDRKSTRLNSSHTVNSYAVFCLNKQGVMHPTSPGYPRNPCLNFFGREDDVFLAEFLDARIATQGIEHSIEAQQRGTEGRGRDCT